MKGSALFHLVVLAALLAPGGADARRKQATLTTQDHAQIQQLYATYAQALDRGEGERFASTFAEDGEFVGGRARGNRETARPPIKGWPALVRLGGFGGRRHFTSNLVITPTAEGASGSCYLLVLNVSTTPATIAETAIYEDLLVRTRQGWKFKRRVVWRDDDDLTPFKPRPVPSPSIPPAAPEH